MRDRPGTLTAAERAEVDVVLAEVLKKVVPPAGFGIVAEGSLGEGFANSRSDYDLTFLADTSESLPSAPTYVFMNGRRAEVSWKSVTRLRELAERVNACAIEDAESLTFYEMMGYQRFCNSAIVRDQPFIATTKSWFRPEKIAALFAERTRKRCLSYARRGLAMRDLDRPDLQLAWCRSALEFAALSWASSNGESYVEHKYLKWLPLQLERAGAPPALAEQLWALLGATDEASAVTIDRIFRCYADFGISGIRQDDPITATRSHGVETFSVAEVTHLLRGESIFVLSGDARLVWAALENGLDLHDGPAKLAAPPESLTRAILFSLHDKGLIALNLSDGDSWERDDSAQPDRWSGPFLCARGALPPADGSQPHVWLMPIPARGFVSGFAHLMFTHMTVENSLEDACGAADAGQYRVAQQALRNLVRLVAQALCLANGCAMPPPQEEAISRLAELASVEPSLIAEVEHLERLEISSADEADQAIARSRAFLASLPERFRARYFDGVTQSIEVYERWIRVGFEAMLLAHRTDAPLPTPQAKDLLKFFPGGAQPRLRPESAPRRVGAE